MSNRKNHHNIVDETTYLETAYNVPRHFSNSQKKRAEARQPLQEVACLVRQQELLKEFENLKLDQKELQELKSKVEKLMIEKCGFFEESYQILNLRERLAQKIADFKNLSFENFLNDKARSSEHPLERIMGKAELASMSPGEENEIIAQNEYLFKQNTLERNQVEIDRIACLEQANVLKKTGFVDEGLQLEDETNNLIAKQRARTNPRPFFEESLEK